MDLKFKLAFILIGFSFDLCLNNQFSFEYCYYYYKTPNIENNSEKYVKKNSVLHQ